MPPMLSLESPPEIRWDITQGSPQSSNESSI